MSIHHLQQACRTANRISHHVGKLAKGVRLDVDVEGQVAGIETVDADAALLAMTPALPDTAAVRDPPEPHAA